MFNALRKLRTRVLEALQRNAETAARLLNDTTAMHYMDSADLHPANRVSTEVQWHCWDGRRWRPVQPPQTGSERA